MKHLAVLIGVTVLTAAFASESRADPVFSPPPPAEGHAYPDCYCTNRGIRVPIGAKSCLRIGSREFTARCGMSLNNPAWRDKKEGCEPEPVSQSAPMSTPVQPG